jgi:branched-chain amino acid transport system permease protein
VRKKGLVRFIPLAVVGAYLLTLPIYSDLSIVGLTTKILIFGLLVMSLDLLVGFTGLSAFGHAAFFGIAAYTVAVLSKHFEITSFWLAAPAGILMATFAAGLFGLVALRVSGVYFLLITLAMGQLVFGIVHTSVGPLGKITGGSDGLGGVSFPEILGYAFEAETYYYLCLVAVVACSLLLLRITRSPFGYGLQGIRENETRARALGYNTWLYQYIAFVVGGFFAGIAGVLYVYYNGFVSPEAVGIGASGLLWLMLILGGSGTLWGGMIGAAAILVLQYFVGGFTPERWPLILGVCFVAVIMFYRGGILPQLTKLWSKVMDRGSTES